MVSFRGSLSIIGSSFLAVLLCFVSVLAEAEGVSKSEMQKNNIVSIKQGLISGLSENGVDTYLGIPYAEPPIGHLRWRPSQDPKPWSGVRKAIEFGSACHQIGNFYTSNNADDFDRPYGSEDCLYLNVWVPEDIRGERPVVVFIHGGGSVHGAASLPLYNGMTLAKELNAVFVSINYRLGFYGNMSSADLRLGDPAGDSGNFAVLDQIKALDWVQNNIGSFGGDAANVTLMGHSAGCGNIWHLMRSPLASGKFHKTFCMSGISNDSSREDLDEAGQALLTNLLIADGLIPSKSGYKHYLETTTSDQRRDYLYSKSSLDILKASEGVTINPPAVDGYVITAGKNERLVNAVASVVGTTDDEAGLLYLGGFSKKNYAGLWELIHSDKQLERSDFFENILDYIKFKMAVWIIDPVLLHLVDKSTELLKSSAVPVYRYHFEWKDTPEPWRSLIGSYHGIDVPFVFGNFETDTPSFTDFTWRVSGAEQRENMHSTFSKAMRGFIESTDPNKYAPQLRWSPWNSDDDDLILR